jgi:hypothetical protein
MADETHPARSAQQQAAETTRLTAPTDARGSSAASTGRGGEADEERYVLCQFPGCTHRIPYSGKGRPPAYCGQTIGGVAHTRLTVHRMNNRGEQPTAVIAGGDASASSAEEADAPVRPVSLARASLESLQQQIGDVVAVHEARMTVLAAQIREAVATASDPDAAAAEVTSAHREARALVDVAETARDEALTAARAAARAAERAATEQAAAEQIAEQSLAETEAAEHARDEAVDRAESAAEQLIAVTADRDDLGRQLAAVRQEVTDLRHDRDQVAEQLEQQQVAVAEQRQRAEIAEKAASRAEGRVEQLTGQVAEQRAQLSEATSSRDALQADLAGVRAELAAAQAQSGSERAAAQQRLEDLRAQHADQLAELRAAAAPPTAENKPRG